MGGMVSIPVRSTPHIHTPNVKVDAAYSYVEHWLGGGGILRGQHQGE